MQMPDHHDPRCRCGPSVKREFMNILRGGRDGKGANELIDVSGGLGKYGGGVAFRRRAGGSQRRGCFGLGGRARAPGHEETGRGYRAVDPIDDIRFAFIGIDRHLCIHSVVRKAVPPIVSP